MRNSCMPPIRKIGSTPTATTMMPMPPSHWRSARHRRMPGGAESSPLITVEPVVVMPDMASKKASVKLRPRSEKAKGREAKAANTTQLAVVSTKAWRIVSLTPRVRLVSTRAPPTNRVSAAESANTCQSGWPTAASARAGMPMATARVASRMPTMKKTGRKSIKLGPRFAGANRSARPERCPHRRVGPTPRPDATPWRLGPVRRRSATRWTAVRLSDYRSWRGIPAASRGQCGTRPACGS